MARRTSSNTICLISFVAFIVFVQLTQFQLTVLFSSGHHDHEDDHNHHHQHQHHHQHHHQHDEDHNHVATVKNTTTDNGSRNQTLAPKTPNNTNTNTNNKINNLGQSKNLDNNHQNQPPFFRKLNNNNNNNGVGVGGGLKRKSTNSYTNNNTNNNTNNKKKKKNYYYAKSPFLGGYKPTGGALPHDAADFLGDPRMWKYVDNRTCILPPHGNRDDGYNRDDEYDKDETPAWQRRAPYALLLGAMKAGTHAVMASLWEHDQIARTGHWEMHFYDSPRAIRSDKGIHQGPTLQNYAAAFRKAIPNFDFDNNDNNDNNHNNDNDNDNVDENNKKDKNSTKRRMMTKMVGVESSPRYLLNSDRIPDMITCVTPWVKMIAILRDPIARVESQYRFLDETRHKKETPMVDWDTWIQDDLRLLQQAGVINDNHNHNHNHNHNNNNNNNNTTIAYKNSIMTPAQEYDAWKAYQRRPNSNQIVGRGLYVIQIEHYHQAMDRVGKSREDLYLMQSERFRTHRQEEYDGLLHFLNLPLHRLRNGSEMTHATNLTLPSSVPMPDAIRTQLQDFYRPYNERLYRLLGWERVWE